jgi:hypothetical protein
MKLSEAIRLGAMMHPQGRMVLFDGVRTCALGAALAAVGKLDRDAVIADIFLSWPWLHGMTFGELLVKPQCLCFGDWATVGDMIMMLNDAVGWTRERIADWVETVERQMEDREARTTSEVREEILA